MNRKVYHKVRAIFSEPDHCILIQVKEHWYNKYHYYTNIDFSTNSNSPAPSYEKAIEKAIALVDNLTSRTIIYEKRGH